MSTSFSSTGLHGDLLANLSSLGYQDMTAIQAQSLPAIIAGQDVIAQAKTGSGKTAAFGLGLLNKLDVKRFRVQALVLCPTRELADQVATEIRKLARQIHNIKVLTLCGGMPFGPQIASLEHHAHIVVGTPGRILDHVQKGRLKLQHLETLVLDEADRMLDMGFQDALEQIIAETPQQRQTLLFSATYPDKIATIAKGVMKSPLMVKVESKHDTSSIRQSFYRVEDIDSRLQALQLLLHHHQPASSVVFCNTKSDAQWLADCLKDDGFSALAIHGDLEQRDRDQTLIRFANKSTAILVATDVAARGLDIAELDAVFNFHLSRDPEVHVHRIGRTGRAGQTGIACSLFADKEAYKVGLLEEYLGQDIDASPLPPISLLGQAIAKPDMVTVQLDVGKKQKIRPGDILGALTGENGIQGQQVGKINVGAQTAFVAVKRNALKTALKKLEQGKIKGKKVRVRVIRG